MDDNGFIHKKNYCDVVVSKGSINVWSKCYDASFHMTSLVCISASKYIERPLLILPAKQVNRDVIESCDIEGSNITTAPISLSIILYFKSVLNYLKTLFIIHLHVHFFGL